MRLPILLAASLAAGALTAPALASPPADDSWSGRLDADLRAFHAALLDSHPGPVDVENPGFAPLLEQGLAKGLERVPDTRDFGGYWWALREFQASFDDGHVQFFASDATPELETRWPGFLTRYAGPGEHLVAVHGEDAANLPPPGARLMECDGVAADALAAERVGRFHGNWNLTAQRMRRGPALLLDQGNPWAPLPRECRFSHEGRSWTQALDWQPLDAEQVRPMLDAAGPGFRTTTGLRNVARVPWVGMSGFATHPSSPDVTALTELLATLREAPEVAEADTLVLDLRGNRGGSSHWSHEIAAVLWGREAVDALPDTATVVDWRISASNVADMEETLAGVREIEGIDPRILQAATKLIDGLRGALANGDTLWRETAADNGEEGTPAPATPRRLAPGARVYVLTSAICASACLDALDAWRALGAIHVGQETLADTLYMDVRYETLPSGLARIAVPMKVYRGRVRGNNEPHVPDHTWDGDIGDDAAIAEWISRLD